MKSKLARKMFINLDADLSEESVYAVDHKNLRYHKPVLVLSWDTKSRKKLADRLVEATKKEQHENPYFFHMEWLLKQ